MTDLAANMALHGGCGSLGDALALPPGQVQAFFESKPFKDAQKTTEANAKVQAAIVSRLNGVIGAICQLPKAMRR